MIPLGLIVHLRVVGIEFLEEGEDFPERQLDMILIHHLLE